jgi:hypothetical protein
MDYTKSLDAELHAPTGNAYHEDTKALPTVWSDKDANSIIWSLMEVVKAGGGKPMQFDKDVPASYQQLLKSLNGLSRAIVTGSSDPVAPPALGAGDKFENETTGEIWQYFDGIGWATIARQQGAKISGDASLTKFGAGSAWVSPVALKSFVVPRDGDVSIQADVSFINASNLTFCYSSIYKNLAQIEGNQTQYPVPCVTPYQSATLTASRVKVFKGDVITVGFAVGMSCNCQYAFNVQYIN